MQLKLIREGSYGSQLYEHDVTKDKVQLTKVDKDSQNKGIKKAGKNIPNFDPELQGSLKSILQIKMLLQFYLERH